MTTNSPNPVDGDVQALIADCQTEIEDLKRSIDRCDAIGTSDYLHHLQSKLKRQYAALAALTAEPVADVIKWSHPKEERRCSVQLRKFDLMPCQLYTTPPAQLLRPVELPTGYTSGYSSLGSDERFIRKSELIAALSQQGYEVKND